VSRRRGTDFIHARDGAYWTRYASMCGLQLAAPGVIGVLPIGSSDSTEVTCPRCIEKLAESTERQLKGETRSGTATGRFSSGPNLQNLPRTKTKP